MRCRRIGLLLVAASALQINAWAQSPVGFWDFRSDSIDGAAVMDQTGGRDATILGEVELYTDGQIEALSLDGRNNSVSIADNVSAAGLPVREITLEAWVSVETPIRWGGIVGAFQDNGGFEKGWVLGYDNSRFNFALSTTDADDGDGILTYLTATAEYQPRQWYHVVGTFDGAVQQIYVNGILEGSSTLQAGDILYPDSLYYDIGVYHDDNEFFPFHGLIKEVKVYDRALSAAEVETNFQLFSFLAESPLPTPTPTPLPGPTPTPGPFDNRKVLILGIDGCRPDALLAADTPNLDSLWQGGAYSFEAQSVDITSSGPAWSSMLTGVDRDKHGVTNNGFSGSRYDLFPHFFRRFKDFRFTGLTASIVHWSPINDFISEGDDIRQSGLGDAAVAEAAAELLRTQNPAAIFLHFDDVDGAGHGGGYDPPYPPGNRYRQTIETTDGHVGTVLSALYARPNFASEEWLILAGTDHGGTGGGHGQNIPEHRTIFIIVNGFRVTPSEITPPPDIYDIAVTALAHLGVPLEPSWELDGEVVGTSQAVEAWRDF